MPTAAFATAAAALLAGEDREERLLVLEQILSISTGVLTFGAVCGWLFMQGRSPKPPRRR